YALPILVTVCGHLHRTHLPWPHDPPVPPGGHPDSLLPADRGLRDHGRDRDFDVPGRQTRFQRRSQPARSAVLHRGEPALCQLLPILIMFILAIFFFTAADSASVVMGILTTRGSQNPPKLVVVFWGLVMAGIAVVMLLLGDAEALEGLQSLVIITAVPFAIIMLMIIVAWFRELRTDPHTLRQKYADLAIENAVVDGVDRYDDDFRLEVTRTAPGQGAGAAVDSLHEDYTGWYQRTDENGQP